MKTKTIKHPCKDTLFGLAAGFMLLTIPNSSDAQTGSYDNVNNPDDVSISEVLIHSDGVYNYKTFKVESPEAMNRYVGIWLMPSLHADGNYTTFNVFVNGIPAGSIIPNMSNWQSVTLSTPVSLIQGVNSISIRVTAPESPMVETIRLGATIDEATVSSEEYEEYLEESMQASVSGEGTSSPDYQSVSPNSVGLENWMEMSLKYSFYTTVSLAKGQDVFFTSNSDKPHAIDVLFTGSYPDMEIIQPGEINSGAGTSSNSLNSGFTPVNPPTIFTPATSDQIQGLNWKRTSETMSGSNMQVATLRIPSVPVKGEYLVRLRTLDNNVQGVADLMINNQYFYDSCPISCSKANYIIPADGNCYRVATQLQNAATQDPMLFVYGNDADRIVGWSKDGNSSFMQSQGLNPKDAYIGQIYKVKTSSISMNSQSSTNPSSTCAVLLEIPGSSNMQNVSPQLTQSENELPAQRDAQDDSNCIRMPSMARLGTSIEITAEENITMVMACDIFGNRIGRLTAASKELSIPLSSLNIDGRGTYILMLETGSRQCSRKLVVK